jgi:hypothetical protein
MFYYLPPKSSIWGHSLRRMSAAREKALFEQFLESGVAESKFVSASAQRNGFQMLTEQQCEQHLQSIIADGQAGRGEGNSILLVKHIAVSKWRIDGQQVATCSHFRLHYGQLPCISTFLIFDTMEHFRYIAALLQKIGLCKLNEKHLKRLKAARGVPIEFRAGLSADQIEAVARKLNAEA